MTANVANELRERLNSLHVQVASGPREQNIASGCNVIDVHLSFWVVATVSIADEKHRPARMGLAHGANLHHVQPMLEKQIVAIADIRVPLKRKKTLIEGKVQEIAESIIEVGQTTPIQVRVDGDGYVLVEGLHRLEALRSLGETSVESYLVRARLH